MKRNDTRKIIFFSVCLAAVLTLVVSLAVWNGRSRITVAFVNIPDKVQESLSSQILERTKRRPVYKTFSSDLFDAGKISKKADIVFSYNGGFAEELSAFAREIPSSVLQAVPENFIQTKTALPVLLDHHGIFYYNSAMRKASARYASDFSTFEAYLQKTKPFVEFPLYVSGGSDKMLLGFVGAVAEGVYGSGAYAEFLNALKDYSTMENLLAYPISEEKTVKDVFDIVSDFQNKGYLHTAWLVATVSDFKNCTLDSRFSVAFAALSDFRSLGSSLGQGFSMDRMPVKDASVKHGIIAPVIQVFCTSKKKAAAEVVSVFSQIDVQKNLADGTELALASAIAPSFDKEADDVRFLAASCGSGPLSDPLAAAFDLDEKRGKSFCRDLRLYLGNLQ